MEPLEQAPVRRRRECTWTFRHCIWNVAKQRSDREVLVDHDHAEDPGSVVDVIVAAGNVMGFLAPSTRVDVLRRFATHLADDGRAIIGFGAGRGYDFRDFLADCEQAGLVLQVPLSTWDLRPFTEDSTFIVALCGQMMTMPGLPRRPSAVDIGLEGGLVVGLH